MRADIDSVRVTITPAAHHWQASLRLVLQLGGDQYFVLLSYADGSAAIHRAIDEHGTVGGDWWGTVHALSLENCLARFAEENGVSLERFRTVIDTLAPGPVALGQNLSASSDKPEGDSSSSAKHRDVESSA